MGLFGFLHRSKADKSNRDFDATMVAIDREQKRREDEWRRRDELLRRDGRPLALEGLETGVPGLPIEDGEHLAKHVLAVDVEAGVTRESRVDWYAWPDEAEAFSAQLAALEDDLEAILSEVRDAPRLCTDLSHVAAQRAGEEPADGPRVCLRLMPLTKTGRAPKCPVEIAFTTMGGHDVKGSHGTVSTSRTGGLARRT